MSRVADPETTSEAARYEAQRLAFAPLIFQACRALRDTGILALLRKRGSNGVTADDAVAETRVSVYAAALLLEAGFAGGLCACEPTDDVPRFVITKAGVYWLHDELTRVHAEFVHHVCYEAAFRLDIALREGVPAGLCKLTSASTPQSREPAKWTTVYEALSELSPEVRRAWFEFDHYHSDGVFSLCIERVFAALATSSTASLVDIGGNTGKFARLVLTRAATPGTSPLRYTMVDLPGQIATAREELGDLAAHAAFAPRNLLDPDAPLPNADVVWMSQFLDCFSEAQIVSILKRVAHALSSGGRVFILETFWDKQRHAAARHCVIGTSLYFACVANGTSRMYHSAAMRRLIRESGLIVLDEDHQVGLFHSLLTCGLAP